METHQAAIAQSKAIYSSNICHQKFCNLKYPLKRNMFSADSYHLPHVNLINNLPDLRCIYGCQEHLA
jgi:hypothetical protein